MIAFQAFLLLLLYLPGALFVLTFVGRGTKDPELPTLGSMSSRAWLALTAGIVFHGVWSGLVAALSRFSWAPFRSAAPEYLELLSGAPQDGAYARAVEVVVRGFGATAFYFVSLCAFAALVGALAYRAIDRNRLYNKYRWLRFDPPWHYLLSASTVDTNDVAVLADVTVELGGECVIYSGTVSEYWFDEHGALDAILLQDATRQRIPWNDGAAEASAAPLPIVGETLVVKYSEAKNINVMYVTTDDVVTYVHFEPEAAS